MSKIGRWFFSLQFRLVVGFALVLTLALFSVGLYTGYAARQETERFEQVLEKGRADRLQQLVTRLYAKRRGWTGLQPPIEQAASLYGWRIQVRDPQGNIVADSDKRFGRPMRPMGPHMRFAPVFSGDVRVGSFLITSSEAPEVVPEPGVSRLASSVNRSLLWAGLAAFAGGILLVSLLSRRVLAPVRTLTVATMRLGQGDLSQRVPITGPDEIGEMARTFNSMAEGLERAEQQRRSLMADVAHELRTPLSNIQGYLEAIRDGLLEPDSETIDTLHGQVVYLAHLVEDLRLLALVEAGALRLDIAPDSLADVLRRSVEAFRPRAEGRRVSVSLDIAQRLPLVTMDRTRTAQVVGNLLENAISHTPAGGAVSVLAEVVGTGKARVTVADTGEGMPPEDLSQVFERFYRVDPSRARATGGAGLGLTIAKQLVEAQGGVIRAESAPGMGSRFIFDLPLAHASLGE